MSRKFILPALVLSMLAASSAFAARWNFLGGVDMARPDQQTFTEKSAFGGGILPEFALGNRGGLELGFLYMQRSTTYSTSISTYPGRSISVASQLDLNVLEVPLVFRFWLARALAFGIGGYYAAAIGDATVTTTYNGVNYKGSSPASGSDFGALANLRLDIPFGKSFGFVIDGRYLYGLTSDKWRVIEGLAGFRFGGGGK